MPRDTYPLHSKTAVSKAGKLIQRLFNSGCDNTDQYLDSMATVENWRASHNHILNSWQKTLGRRIKNQNIIFAQRLKRRNTIIDKLTREPHMALANMHDVAGCRLIFENIKQLDEYRNSLHQSNSFKHRRVKADQDPYNYILSPASSGYRGIHDVYIYEASHPSGQKWNGLKVEIQYRTIAQHAWATTVEVAGSVTGNHSKFDRGSEDQKEFFRLASEIIARTHEHMNSCYSSLSNTELIERYTKLERKIHLLRTLKTLKIATIKFPDTGKIMILESQYRNGDSSVTQVHTFDSLPKATQKYFELEKNATDNDDIVLVKSQSGDHIRHVYKNYFSDTKDFIHFVETGIAKLRAS